MSKNREEPVEPEPKDEKTGQFLHKLAEKGKERGIPPCLVAQYEKNAWEAVKSDEKYTSCEKCGMPPPPPLESVKKCEESPSEVCKNCDAVNKKPIGLESEIAEKERKEEALKKKEERKSLKRPSDALESSSTPPISHTKRRPEMVPQFRSMARKVAPQPNNGKMKFMTPPSAAAAVPSPVPLLLQSTKSAKKAAKKAKIVEEKEPDFLQKLFQIGGNPA